MARSGSVLGTSFDPKHIPDKIVSDGWELSGDYVRVAQTIRVEDLIDRYLEKFKVYFRWTSYHVNIET